MQGPILVLVNTFIISHVFIVVVLLLFLREYVISTILVNSNYTIQYFYNPIVKFCEHPAQVISLYITPTNRISRSKDILSKLEAFF